MKQSDLEMCRKAYEMYPDTKEKQEQYLSDAYGIRKEKAVRIMREFRWNFAHKVRQFLSN